MAEIEMVRLKAIRNRITGGGVSIRLHWNKEGLRVTTNFDVKCVEHNIISERFKTISAARVVVHRPWKFCDQCHKVAFGYNAKGSENG